MNEDEDLPAVGRRGGSMFFVMPAALGLRLICSILGENLETYIIYHIHNFYNIYEVYKLRSIWIYDIYDIM